MPIAGGATSPPGSQVPTAGATPPSPAGAPPTAATGPTPATTPVPNRGSEQTALLAIGMHAHQIQTLLGDLPFGGEAAQAIGEALNKIRKYVPPPGSTASGVEKTQLDAMRASQQQNAMRQALQRQQQAAAGGAGAGGGIPPKPPGGTMQPSQGM